MLMVITVFGGKKGTVVMLLGDAKARIGKVIGLFTPIHAWTADVVYIAFYLIVL